ncbi:MAG: response regulator [Minisyncoccia bacterium]
MGTHMPKKILLVDDAQIVQMTLKALWNRQFGDEIQVISAVSAEEALEQFALHSDIALIVMDAQLKKGSDGPDTLELVKELRRTFTGPIVANSMNERYNKALVDAGCDSISDDKYDLRSAFMKIGLF